MNKDKNLTPTKSIAPAEEVRGTIAKLEPQFKLALPSHIPVERFIRVLQTAINNSPNLVKANRQALLSAAMRAAQDGLLPDGAEAALVTFGDQVAYMPMVKGLLKKLRNSGELKSISPHVVYENDLFDYYINETGEKLQHKPKLTGQRGNVAHVYCIAITKDGGTYIEVMSKEEIDKIRSVSRSKDNGPWVQWYDQMAIKSVIRRLFKRLPSSTDLELVIHADDEIFNPPEPEEKPKEPKTTSSKLKKAMNLAPESQDESSENGTPEVREVGETTLDNQVKENELPI